MTPLLVPIISYLAKGWSRFLSILVWVLIVAGLVWAVYVAFIRPYTKPTPNTTTTVESGGVAYNPTIHVGFGGCARLPIIRNK